MERAQITDFIEYLQAEAPSYASHSSYCNQETSEATQQMALEAVVALFNLFEAAAARSTILDGEISTLFVGAGCPHKEAVQDGNHACR